MHPLISICIPVFNCERWIGDAIDSALMQDVRNNLEIIAVDDGSTDGSGRILDSLAQQHSQIKVIHKENQGVISARADAIDAATGAYIMFLDGDDILAPRSLNATVRLLNQNPTDILFFGYYEFSNNRRKDHLLHRVGELVVHNDRDGLLKQFVYSKTLNNVCFKVIRKELFDTNWIRKFSEIKMGDDWFVSFCPMTSARSFSYLPLGVYGYRLHGTSMTDAFDYGYPTTLLVMHECKMRLADSDLGSCLSNDRIAVSTLIEIAKAIALIPAAPHDVSCFFSMLDALENNGELKRLYQRYRKELHPFFRLPLFLLFKHRFFSILRIKQLASRLRQRR